MKKIIGMVLVLCIVIIAVALTSCAFGGNRSKLVEMFPFPDDEPFHGDFKWGENVYMGYANAAYNNFYNEHRGSQVGYIQNDSELKVFAVNGYDNSEWLFLYLYGEVTLCKGEKVMEVPGELLVLHIASFLPVNETLSVTRVKSGQTTERSLTGKGISSVIEWICKLELNEEHFEPGDSDSGEAYGFDNGYGSVTYYNGGLNNHYIVYGTEWYKVENPSDPPICIE